MFKDSMDTGFKGLVSNDSKYNKHPFLLTVTPDSIDLLFEVFSNPVNTQTEFIKFLLNFYVSIIV